jgi:hypothetical protein
MGIFCASVVAKMKQHVGRGFFKDFQKRVEGRIRQHVDFIDDIYLVGAVGRHVFRIFPQFPDVFNLVVGCAVYFQDIDGISFGYFNTRSALIAGKGGTAAAVCCICQYPGNGGFSCPARPGQSIPWARRPAVQARCQAFLSHGIVRRHLQRSGGDIYGQKPGMPCSQFLDASFKVYHLLTHSPI